MIASDTNNIYHSVIYNVLIALLGRSDEIFVVDRVFARWINRVGYMYQRSVRNPSGGKTHPHCFFGHIYKLIKLTLSLHNNFLQKLLDENCSLTTEAFELFYYPKSEIEKREYPVSTEKFPRWDDSIDRFEDDFDKSDEDNEKRGNVLVTLHGKEIIEIHFSDQEHEDEEGNEESEPASAEQTSFNDVNYWRTRMSFDEESLKDLLN